MSLIDLFDGPQWVDNFAQTIDIVKGRAQATWPIRDKKKSELYAWEVSELWNDIDSLAAHIPCIRFTAQGQPSHNVPLAAVSALNLDMFGGQSLEPGTYDVSNAI